MEYIHFLTAFLVSLAATLLAVPPVRRLAVSQGWVDRPDSERKMHRSPIVYVGGITIVVGIIVGMLYLAQVSKLPPDAVSMLSPYALLGACLIVGMGLIDDIRTLSFRTKFLIQLAAASLLVMGGLRLDLASALVPGTDTDLAFYLALPITVLWIVGIVNAVNLVDGLDGLAGGLTAIALSSLAIVYAVSGQFPLLFLALPILGALTGFLVHNSNPATIFLGNSGSYLLGYVLAAYSLQSPTHADPVVSVLTVLVILGLPVLDTVFSFLRRYLAGSSPFVADCDHFHHRLARRFSHRTAVIMMYGTGLALGLTGVVMAGVVSSVAFFLFGCVVLGGFVGVRVLGYKRIGIRSVNRVGQRTRAADVVAQAGVSSVDAQAVGIRKSHQALEEASVA